MRMDQSECKLTPVVRRPRSRCANLGRRQRSPKRNRHNIADGNRDIGGAEPLSISCFRKRPRDPRLAAFATFGYAGTARQVGFQSAAALPACRSPARGEPAVGPIAVVRNTRSGRFAAGVHDHRVYEGIASPALGPRLTSSRTADSKGGSTAGRNRPACHSRRRALHRSKHTVPVRSSRHSSKASSQRRHQGLRHQRRARSQSPVLASLHAIHRHTSHHLTEPQRAQWLRRKGCRPQPKQEQVFAFSLLLFRTGPTMRNRSGRSLNYVSIRVVETETPPVPARLLSG